MQTNALNAWILKKFIYKFRWNIVCAQNDIRNFVFCISFRHSVTSFRVFSLIIQIFFLVQTDITIDGLFSQRGQSGLRTLVNCECMRANRSKFPPEQLPASFASASARESPYGAETCTHEFAVWRTLSKQLKCSRAQWYWLTAIVKFNDCREIHLFISNEPFDICVLLYAYMSIAMFVCTAPQICACMFNECMFLCEISISGYYAKNMNWSFSLRNWTK